MAGAHRRVLAAGSMLAVLTLSVAACTSSNSSSGSSGSAGSSAGSGKSGTIALLLPETKTTRYESADKPYFEAKFKALCPSCKIIYSNADQNAATQQNQADQAITNGAKVLVLDPVDGTAAGTIAKNAAARGVKVVSYDRLIKGAPVDAYISFDNELVGKIQGQALVKQLGASAKSDEIIMIDGSADDNNALLFKKGAHEALDGNIKGVAYETFTPDWAPDTAGTEMDQAITKVGKGKFAAVYSANDGMAGAIVASLKRAGITPVPPVTGQDAELTAVQRILTGDQFMTVYKAIKPEAEQAAQLAFNLLQGQSISGIATASTANGAGNVPSVLLTPVELTKSNIESTVIKDGFIKVSDLCAGSFAAACTANGIS